MNIGIIACGAIVRELIAIAKRQAWDFELTAVPAQLHNHPERIAPAVAAKLDGWAARFDLILLGYADCGTAGALDVLVARYDHVVRIPGPHCYEFFGGETFTRHNDTHLGTFYLTDFLAHHFDGLVWKGLGLDRHPELRDLYFGNYTHLLYLQQLPAHNESARAQAAAARLGVEFVQVETGLGTLEKRLVHLVEKRRQQLAAQQANSHAAPFPQTVT
ncbi:MAG: DUF1638 domain-containing protein [Caldilineaceae bacterium]|nr:DUF1638 domain-containing protein [Caldilineaceae bacterium]